MNGFISGVPNASYFLDVVTNVFVSDFSPLVDVLAGDRVNEINVSVGKSFDIDDPIFGLINKLQLDTLTLMCRRTVQRYPSVLFSVAAGDGGTDVVNTVPANLGGPTGEPNVIAVGATDLQDSRAAFQSWGSSNFGSGVDIAAPGVGVYTPALFNAPLDIHDYYVFFGGTSASAPMVTGAAAILKAIEGATPSRTLSPQQIKSILITSADPITTDKPIGARLNILRAVQQALAPPGRMDDNFNGSSVNTALWFVTIVPAGVGTISETNQQLEMTRITPASSSYQGLASKCKVSGDFDVQADYRLLNWPAQNFYTVRLAAQDLPQGDIGLVGVYRNSYADENYQFRSQVGLAGLVVVSTTDTSGTLGLRRSGSTISGYDSHGTISSASTTQGPTGFVIDFATPLPTSPLNVAIAFDNFKVNSGTVSCP
jgi:hypothetical protein